MSSVIDEIRRERERQIAEEGWTPEHDDEHVAGELSHAAACYAISVPDELPPPGWPWAWKWWKPKDRRSNLVRSCALLVAEIERLDRLKQQDQPQA